MQTHVAKNENGQFARDYDCGLGYHVCDARMVGRVGLEPTTKGLLVPPNRHFTVLIEADRINTNQQVTQSVLDGQTA